MKIKEIAIDTIKSLPDKNKKKKIKERIEFVAGIRKALKELDEGKGTPHTQIEEESSTWISK